MQTFILPMPESSTDQLTQLERGQSAIIIGANGAGKTRLGVWIEQQIDQFGTQTHDVRKLSSVHRIAAQNSLKMPTIRNQCCGFGKRPRIGATRRIPKATVMITRWPSHSGRRSKPYVSTTSAMTFPKRAPMLCGLCSITSNSFTTESGSLRLWNTKPPPRLNKTGHTRLDTIELHTVTLRLFGERSLFGGNSINSKRLPSVSKANRYQVPLGRCPAF